MTERCNYNELGESFVKDCRFNSICVEVVCPRLDGNDLTTGEIDAQSVLWEEREVEVDGVSRKVVYRDFAIEVADLVIDGQQVKPEVGWLIRWRGCVYRVGKREEFPAVGWHDGFRKCYVIRTSLCEGEE